ncbi:MAG: cAMP-binding protein [candidate division NC10 bacterium]|nr:cAMP-binding protein [candidate division NC10 bacterium]
MASLHWRDWATDPEQLRRLDLLGKVPLFAGMSRHQLGKLLVKLFEKEYAPGETIFLEGEPGKALFIVLDGMVSIFHSGHGAEERVTSLARGAYFGELALIDDLPRSASARADEQSALLILYKSHFDDLIEGHSTIAIRVMGNLLKALAGYVRAAHARSAGHAATLPGSATALEQGEKPLERPDR